MAFTEKDMQAQEEQLSALKDELSRLNQKFDAQLKGMGLTEDDLKQQEAMTPEVEALVAKAKEEAKRAGEARKAQASLDNRPSGKAPGAGRRGVVRLQPSIVKGNIMSQISGVGNSGSVGGVDSLGTCTSVNFIFAKLQMELAASAKDSALGYIDQIEQAQKDQKEIADMLQQCRQLQADAKTSGGCTTMPDNIVKFMDKNGLAYDKTGNDTLHNKDEWDVAIQSLQAYQEQIGTDIQTQMVYVQDFMGQYNSYTQGANSAIQSGMQTLTAVARGQ